MPVTLDPFPLAPVDGVARLLTGMTVLVAKDSRFISEADRCDPTSRAVAGMLQERLEGRTVV